jgi:hypothetical protein
MSVKGEGGRPASRCRRSRTCSASRNLSRAALLAKHFKDPKRAVDDRGRAESVTLRVELAP